MPTKTRGHHRRKVGGWVRNEPDGSVCSELEGTGRDVGLVLAGLRDQYAHAHEHYRLLRGLNFTLAACEWHAPRGERDFEVRF